MRHFLAVINAHVDVCRIVRLLDCFVFCFARFECYKYTLHSLFLARLFVCFSYFILAISPLHWLLPQVSPENMPPVSRSSLFFLPVFFCCGVWGNIFWWFDSWFVFFFSFPIFGTLITVLTFWSFSSWWWIHLFLPFSCYFLRVSCLACLWMHMDRLQDPLRLQKPSRYSVMIKWRPSHSFNPCSPSTCLPTIMSCTPNNHSFYLLLRLLGANASPCTHPNPCPPSWVPLYPFMSAHICVSFLGNHTLLTYFCLFFCCLFVR